MRELFYHVQLSFECFLSPLHFHFLFPYIFIVVATTSGNFCEPPSIVKLCTSHELLRLNLHQLRRIASLTTCRESPLHRAIKPMCRNVSHNLHHDSPLYCIMSVSIHQWPFKTPCIHRERYSPSRSTKLPLVFYIAATVATQVSFFLIYMIFFI